MCAGEGQVLFPVSGGVVSPEHEQHKALSHAVYVFPRLITARNRSIPPVVRPCRQILLTSYIIIILAIFLLARWFAHTAFILFYLIPAARFPRIKYKSRTHRQDASNHRVVLLGPNQAATQISHSSSSKSCRRYSCFGLSFPLENRAADDDYGTTDLDHSDEGFIREAARPSRQGTRSERLQRLKNALMEVRKVFP